MQWYACHSVELQLLIFLNYLSMSGSGSNFKNVGDTVDVGKGAAVNAFGRVLKAVLNLKQQVLYWPDVSRRQQISRRIHMTYSFKNCIGFIEGTTRGLVTKPQWMGHDLSNYPRFLCDFINLYFLFVRRIRGSLPHCCRWQSFYQFTFIEVGRVASTTTEISSAINLILYKQ
jgi:hypothetical protein